MAAIVSDDVGERVVQIGCAVEQRLPIGMESAVGELTVDKEEEIPAVERRAQ